MQLYFGVGKISEATKDRVVYRVLSLNDLIQVIIPHFEKYPLLAQKKADFLLFKSALKLINEGKHLLKEGLIEIVNIKASMNRGLSLVLKQNFPGVMPVERLLISNQIIADPSWLAGFTSAEGFFFVSVGKSKNKTGYAVSLWFTLTQDSRDVNLFEVIKNYLNCGNVLVSTKDPVVKFNVTKFTDNFNIVVPFFSKFNLWAKSKDFLDFCRVAELINDKSHLTNEGLEKILKIKSEMNTGRKFNEV
uniref:LAGLIDADG endonuclease n=2 Tax=Orbiliaceae TaxID=47021 RepID=A0A411P222_9PEZI|nr:LAGLIDADG endonuclease [Orbilia dorsalia]QBF58422.1 LAGLIDADG endonuclease [Orbilia dorsalia]QBM09703.1 hypothetical protein [Dactylella sp.]